MRMVRVRAYNNNAEPWFDEIFEDIQDFDPTSWTNAELAIVLEGLERDRYYVESFGRECYLYEYVGLVLMYHLVQGDISAHV